jgi:hypothetical protein
MADRSPLFVDLSGYAFTGKHAVIDLLREIDGYYVPHFQYEFALLRIQGGILDLEHALCGDWSPMRSDAAIRRFKQVVRRLGTKASWSAPRTWFDAVGWNYDEVYHHRFFELSDRYVESLVVFSWRAEWPFALSEFGDLDFLARRIARKLGFRRALEVPVFLAHTDRFVPLTRDYLRELLTANVGSSTRAVVMHNAFEPYNPQRSLKFFDRAKSIVVDRDPRDSYVQHLTFPPNAVGVRDYITRYRINRQAVRSDPHPDVLRLQFEDLVLDYDKSLARILAHLGEDREAHVRPRQHFDPAVSKKNVGLWRYYAHPHEIRLIEQSLPEYCVDLAAKGAA